jgi:hypothetical protein
MKKVYLFCAFLTFTALLNCQVLENVHAYIKGYKLNDTISMADFMKLTELSVNNSDYTISGFRFNFDNGGWNISEQSTSGKISDVMKKQFTNRPDKNASFVSVYFEKITARSSKNEVINLDPLIFRIRVK